MVKQTSAAFKALTYKIHEGMMCERLAYQTIEREEKKSIEEATKEVLHEKGMKLEAIIGC